MSYPVNRNGQHFGPYTLDDLHRNFRSGHLQPTDLSWSTEAQRWIPLSELLGGTVTAPLPPDPPQRQPAPTFLDRLRQATPTAYLAPLLIVVNVAVFALMWAQGVSPLEPTTTQLVHWGADYGPLTTQGEWWRLFSSTFVHIGMFHLAMNMYVLFGIGEFTERLFGNFCFLVLYVASGIGGSLASEFMVRDQVSAGASGAIFGLYGGLLAFLLIQRHTIPGRALKGLLRNAAFFVLFNLAYGALQTGIDMSAHLGGLVSGFFVGLIMAQAPARANAISRFLRGGAALVASSALALAAIANFPAAKPIEGEARTEKPADAQTTAPVQVPAQQESQPAIVDYSPEDTPSTRYEYGGIVHTDDNRQMSFTMTLAVEGDRDIAGLTYHHEVLRSTVDGSDPTEEHQYTRWAADGIYQIDGDDPGKSEHLETPIPLRVGSDWVVDGRRFEATGLEDVRIDQTVYQNCMTMKITDSANPQRLIGTEYFCPGIGVVKLEVTVSHEGKGAVVTTTLRNFQR